jgi:ribosomal protein L32E
MLEGKIKQSGYTWKSYSEILGENPSNFKRKLVQNIEKLNKWLEPLNLQIQIAPKCESAVGKNKRKEK